MKMLEVAEYSPSFARMSPAVIEYALQHGAAKVDNMLSVASYTALLEDSAHQTPEQLAGLAPEVGYYFTLLGIGPEDDRIIAKYYDVFANNENHKPNIHRDSNIVKGISLLFPYHTSAVFGASNTRFSTDTMPDRVWQYGPRDGMVLRQGLRRFNGRRIRIQQAWHCGVRDKISEIFAIDFHTPELEMDVSIKPYESE